MVFAPSDLGIAGFRASRTLRLHRWLAHQRVCGHRFMSPSVRNHGSGSFSRLRMPQTSSALGVTVEMGTILVRSAPGDVACPTCQPDEVEED